MHSYIASILLLAPLVLAAPTAKEDIHLVWRYDRATSTKSLHAWNTDQTLLIGQSCEDKLDGGNFATHPLTFDVDQRGWGSLQWGEKTYKVHSDAEQSGGIVCHKRYNDDFARVDCRVPNYSGISFQPIAANETRNCLPESSVPAKANTGSQHEKRIGPGDSGTCQNYDFTVKVDDGNPHQNYWDIQLSEPLSCQSNPNCQTTQSQTKSFSIGWSSDISANGWISGGFSVEQSWETGNDYQCGGNSGEQICVWYATAHTAYTVQNMIYDCTSTGSGSDKDGDPYVMYSPNSGGVGSGYYCVHGSCRNQGDAYWDKSGPAGGPQPNPYLCENCPVSPGR